VACKAAKGKSVAAFPDVCLSPPSPPAGPVPIPYPNTAFAKDTANGSKTVKISGKEVMLKNKSCFKKSTGDEAATKALGMGVVSHQITGKVYFASWSMNVKIEGKNAVRHLDLTTHNHMSAMPGNTPVWPYLDGMAVALDHPCVDDARREMESCKGYKPYGQEDPCPPHRPPPTGGADYKQKRTAYYQELARKISDNPCLAARRCMLVPYAPSGRGEGRRPGCCPGQTGHHLIEASAFILPGTRKKGGVPRPGCEGYSIDKAPCICAEGPDNTTATHGLMHTFQGVRAKKRAPAGTWKFKEASETGAAAVNMVFKSPCSQKCIEAQLEAYHQACGIDTDQEIVASPSGKLDSEIAESAWAKYDLSKKSRLATKVSSKKIAS
jgi:uncharacterized Zn-binding protein involved in type VI secretion